MSKGATKTPHVRMSKPKTKDQLAKAAANQRRAEERLQRLQAICNKANVARKLGLVGKSNEELAKAYDVYMVQQAELEAKQAAHEEFQMKFGILLQSKYREQTLKFFQGRENGHPVHALKVLNRLLDNDAEKREYINVVIVTRSKSAA